jgi:hypothetical protein
MHGIYVTYIIRDYARTGPVCEALGGTNVHG